MSFGEFNVGDKVYLVEDGIIGGDKGRVIGWVSKVSRGYVGVIVNKGDLNDLYEIKKSIELDAIGELRDIYNLRKINKMFDKYETQGKHK